MESTTQENHTKEKCAAGNIMAVQDAMEILSGKWKIQIIGSLCFGKKRFKELQRNVNGVTAKMLSKELRDLETNQLVKRTVIDTIPVSVEYELTEHGATLRKVIDELMHWGLLHRKKIMQKEEVAVS